MGKPGKRRWDGKHRHPPKKRGTDKKTPEALIVQGNSQEAVRLLRARIRMTPTDEKKRLLAQSLCELRDFKEAVEVWLTIQEKTWHDQAMIGAILLDLEEWDQAVPHLEASLKLEEVGRVYYWLAVALGKNRASYQLNGEERASIVDLLQKARPLSGCPLEAFLWLDDLVSSEKDDDGQRTTLLREALARYPDAERVRLRLGSHLLYDLSNYEEALAAVTPLLDQADPPQLALAVAFWAAQKGGLFEQALAYTERMQNSPSDCHGPGLAKVKGDLYLAFGKIDEAVSLYEREIQSGDFTAMFIGFFSIAAARLRQHQTSEALAAAAQGAHLWFANPNSSQCSEAVFLEPVYIGTDADSVHVGDESLSECLKEVCVALLAEEQEVDLLLKGQLSYLLFNYHSGHASDEPEEALTALLLQAAAWFEHPHMDQDLAYHYKAVGDFPLAVQHHLAYCLWQFRAFKTYQPLPAVEVDADESHGSRSSQKEWVFRSSTAEFVLDDELEGEEEDDEPVKHKMTPEERRGCHEKAWEILLAQEDSDVICAIFLPFYRSFWHRMLAAEDMHQEIVDVTALLMKASPGAATDRELWSHAYYLSELGRTAEAERAYRSYLERHPDHADTLHNLSLLLEAQELQQEALALSDRAAALVPDDELITGENTRMRKAAQEAQRTQIQRFWSQLSEGQKQLLYLVVERRPSHWSQLAGQARMEEQQLQEQWQALVDRGALQAAPGQAAEVHVSLLPQVRQEGLLLVLIQDIIAQTNPRKKQPWIPALGEFASDATPPLDKTQRTAFHKAAYKRLRSGPDDALLVAVFLPFYRATWRRILDEGSLHQELVDVVRILTTRLPERTRPELWDLAFHAHDIPALAKESEQAYRRHIEGGASAAACHNLSLLLAGQGRLDEALSLAEQATQLDPDDEKVRKHKAVVEQLIERKKQEEQKRQAQAEMQRRKQQDWIRTARDRWPRLIPYRKQILATLTVISGFEDWADLARLSGTDEKFVKGHWKALVEEGMILENEQGYEINPHILDLVKQERSHSMVARIVHASSVFATKPIFNSQNEFRIYSVLIHLFPTCWCFQIWLCRPSSPTIE
jgi:tetratricopeptide (TPR) repeat protein